MEEVFVRYLILGQFDAAKASINPNEEAIDYCEMFITYGPDDPDLLQQIVNLGAKLDVRCVTAAAYRSKYQIAKKLLREGFPANIFRGGSAVDYASESNMLLLLIDYTGKSMYNIPKKMELLDNLRTYRESLRSCAIAMIGVITRRSPLRGERGIGDVTRMIGRAIWESRGIPPDTK
jgi:hypothetical protein